MDSVDGKITRAKPSRWLTRFLEKNYDFEYIWSDHQSSDFFGATDH